MGFLQDDALFYLRHSLYKIFITLSLLIIGACNGPDEEDLIGMWQLSDNYDPEAIQYYLIKFPGENQIELIDDLSFKEIGTFEVSWNDHLCITLNDGSRINTKIQAFAADSIVLFDSLTYVRYEGPDEEMSPPFSLAGIKTDQILDHYRSASLFQLYYTPEGQRQLRLGDRIRPFIDLFLFMGQKRKNSDLLAFIGKGVTVADLETLYLQLAASQNYHINLLLAKDNQQYHILSDSIFVWQEDLNVYLEEIHTALPPPPPPPYPYWLERTAYLQKEGTVLLDYDPIQTLSVLQECSSEKEHIISVGCQISLVEYVALKMNIKRCKEQYGANIKTIISCN